MVNVHTVPLNIGDLLGSTVGLDATVFGALLSLIIAHYQCGEEGLPMDDKKLAQIARVSLKVWKSRVKPIVLQRFQYSFHPSGDENLTKLTHPRCIKVIQEINRKSAQNSTNSLKGWENNKANAGRPHSRRKPIQYP